MVTFLLYFKFPILFEELGFTGVQRGNVFAMMPLFALIGTFWLGVASDRVDARYVMAAGLLALSLFFAGVATSVGVLAFMALFALSGLAGQAYNVGSNAYLFKSVSDSPAEQGLLGRFASSSSFGIALGFISGPLLVAWLGLRWTLYGGAIIALVLIPFLFLLRPVKTPAKRLSEYFRAFRSRRAKVFAVMIFLFTLHWGTEITCYSQFLKQNLGLGESSMGWFMGPPIVMLGLSSLLFGALGAHRVGPRGMLTVAFLFSGLGSLGMVASSNVASAFAWRLLHEFGDGAFILFMLVGIHKLFDERLAGGCAGLVWVIAMVGQGLASLASAPMALAYGYGYPMALAGGLALASLLGLPLLKTQATPALKHP